MAKQQLITVSENVKALVNSLSKHLLDAQRSIFEACKILGNLHQNDSITFKKVKDELIEKKILSQTAIYNFATIGKFQNGFLIKNQNKLPLSYKTLLSIADRVGEDNKKFKKLETLIQNGKINKATEEKEISSFFNLEKLVDSYKVDDEQIRTINNEERDPTEIKIIEIEINRDLLQDKQKDIIRDLKKIKTLMKYASVYEVGRLQEVIENEYDE